MSDCVARAVLYDLSDRGQASTLRVLDTSGLILSQTTVRSDWPDGRRVCLAIAGACGLTLEVVGSPEPVASQVEVRKGRSTGQSLLF